MPFGLEIRDQNGLLTSSGISTVRFIALVNVSGQGGAQTISLSGIVYDGSPFMYFVPSENSQTAGAQGARLSFTASTATIQDRGVAGAAYIGVT